MTRSAALLIVLVGCGSLNQGVWDAGSDAVAADRTTSTDVPTTIDARGDASVDAVDAGDAGPTDARPPRDLPVVVDAPAVDAPADLDAPVVDVPVVVDVPSIMDVRVDVAPPSDVSVDAARDASTDAASSTDVSALGDTGSTASDVGASTCGTGGTLCDGFCVDVQTSAMNCGGCGNFCVIVHATSVSCVASNCVATACEPGWGRCAADTSCRTQLSSDPANCGRCGNVCTAGLCMGGTCVPVAAPRPIWPPSTSTVTTGTPQFKWENPARTSTTGAVVQICNDQACTSVLTSLTTNSGSAARPSTALVAGHTYFWRLFGVAQLPASVVVGTATSPTWEFTVRHAPPTASTIETAYGTTPDYDLDGFGDLAVGAPRATDSAHTTSSGAVRVLTHLARFPVVFASMVLVAGGAATNNSPAVGFGRRVACAGDTNGDGFPDLLVGGGNAAGGYIYVYYGTTTGVLTGPGPMLSVGASASFASAGDFNGDGYGDVVVGDPDRGEATVYLGSATGLSVLNTVTLGGAVTERFGASVASAGDLDLDGRGDVIVGAPGIEPGNVQVFENRVGSMTSSRVYGDSAVGGFGSAVALAGDFDGNGFADVVIGAPGVNSGDGAVYVWGGGPVFLDRRLLTVPGTGSLAAGLGGVVAGVGDMNGDGLDEVAAGAPVEPAPMATTTAGRVRLIWGTTTPLSSGTNVQVLDADASTLSTGNAANFGASIARLGDKNNDGLSDFAIGAPCADDTATPCGVGRAYLVHGAGTVSSTVELFVQLGATGDRFGTSLASLFPAQRLRAAHAPSWRLAK